MGKNRSHLQRKISKEDWDRYKIDLTGESVSDKYHNNVYEPKTEWDYEPVERETICCSMFGCGRNLSVREQLFGNICISCQK